LQKSIKNLAFEIAKKEKKLLDNINFFTSKQNVEFKQAQNYDFLGIYYSKSSEPTNCRNIITFFLFIYRYGKLINTVEATFPV
jgi:excinuclease UvrABC nuclease subunit